MDFEAFMEYIKEHIKEYLPESYQDAEVTIEDYRKLNKCHMGLTIMRPGDKMSPIVNLEALYSQYGETPQLHINDVLQQISQAIQKKPKGFDMSWLTRYDEAKKHLFMKVFDADKNADILEGVPFVWREGLAITFHIVFKETESCPSAEEKSASVIVTNQMMETYGVTKSQLYNDALANSQIIAPVRIGYLSDLIDTMIFAEMSERGVSEEEIRKEKEIESNQKLPLLVVTNDNYAYGASAIFYPDVMDKLGERLKENFFILPSSVHEVIVAPDDGMVSYLELKAMVMEVNAKEVAPEERLTNEVYYYDIRNRIFEKAESFIKRKQGREKAVKA